MQPLDRWDCGHPGSQNPRCLECLSVASWPPIGTWPAPCCRAPFGWAAGALLPAPPLQLQSIQPISFPRKTGFSGNTLLFGASLGAELGAAPSLGATGAPRTALESSTQPRRRRVSRKMVGRLPMLATPRRDDAAARAQMIEIACGVHLQIIDASSSYDNSRRQGRLIGRGARVRRKLGAT